MRRKKDRSVKVAFFASAMVTLLVGISVFSLYSLAESENNASVISAADNEITASSGKLLTRLEGNKADAVVAEPVYAEAEQLPLLEDYYTEAEEVNYEVSRAIVPAEPEAELEINFVTVDIAEEETWEDETWEDDTWYDDEVYDDGWYDDSYDDGWYDDSYDDGWYDDSYDDGWYDDSYDDGWYDDSYDDGWYDDSYDDGWYDDSYDDGWYDDSYDDGYDDGWYDDNSWEDDSYYDDSWYDDEWYEDTSYEDTSYTLGQQIVDYAMQFVGVTPYVWAGRSLYSGTDCSGFVNLIYDAFGIYCSTASAAYNGSSFGYIISADQAQPGDIAVYGGGSHVAIYAGNGYVVHCSSPENGTVYWNMNYRSDLSWFLRVIG